MLDKKKHCLSVCVCVKCLHMCVKCMWDCMCVWVCDGCLLNSLESCLASASACCTVPLYPIPPSLTASASQSLLLVALPLHLPLPLSAFALPARSAAAALAATVNRVAATKRSTSHNKSKLKLLSRRAADFMTSPAWRVNLAKSSRGSQLPG